MAILLGTDIVHVPKIESLLRSEDAARAIFHDSELADGRPEHLAGIFAAKEAYFKALDRAPKWLEIEVKNEKSGRPIIVSEHQAQVSISHDGEYAIATVIIEK